MSRFRRRRRQHPDQFFFEFFFINFVSSNSSATLLTLTIRLASICLHSGGAAGLFRRGPVRSAFIVRRPEIFFFQLNFFKIFYKFAYGTLSRSDVEELFAPFGDLVGHGEVGDEVMCSDFRRFSNGQAKCVSKTVP